MIRSRLLRLGAVVLGTVGMLAMPAPSAQAEEVGEIVFSGNAILDGPLGYPCVPTTPGTPKCPPTPTIENKPGMKGTTKTNVHPGGNRRNFSFSATTCASVFTTVTKTGKDPVGTGPCTIVATGTIEGFCGLSLIKGTATIRRGNQTYTIRFWGHSGGPGGVALKFEGTKTTNGTNPHEVNGEVAAEAVPVPTTGGPPPTTLDNSCGNKTADTFTIAAQGTYHVKTLTS